MTGKFRLKTNNIKHELQELVRRRLVQDSYTWKDIYKIFHIIDTDGTYVSPNYIYYDSQKHFYYDNSGIYSDNIDEVIQRNGHKKKLLAVLIPTNQINAVPYNIYFNSTNIEHVIFGDQWMNASKSDKISLSNAFYNSSPDLKVLDENVISEDYSESWRDIARGLNSLHRKTNLNLVFREIK